MMVVHESYITRKPLEFTLIVLVIVLIILLPVYFYTKNAAETRSDETVLVAETYAEVNYMFGSESDISESDKKKLFKIDYEGNQVQWTGNILSCDDMGGMYRIGVDHRGHDFGDVLFTTFTDCSGIPLGSTITYKIKLIDWKVNVFVGKEGEIIKWD